MTKLHKCLKEYRMLQPSAARLGSMWGTVMLITLWLLCMFLRRQLKLLARMYVFTAAIAAVNYVEYDFEG
jgi:hypothetical protein